MKQYKGFEQFFGNILVIRHIIVARCLLNCHSSIYDNNSSSKYSCYRYVMLIASDIVTKEVSITLHYIILHYYITLHYITLRYVTLRHVTSRNVVTSRHVTSRHVTLRYVTLQYITLHYITSHHITLHYIVAVGWVFFPR